MDLRGAIGALSAAVADEAGVSREDQRVVDRRRVHHRHLSDEDQLSRPPLS